MTEFCLYYSHISVTERAIDSKFLYLQPQAVIKCKRTLSTERPHCVPCHHSLVCPQVAETVRDIHNKRVTGS
jgi:hypothetical protein